MAELTHINEQGRAKMVDVSEKADTKRIGVASARICMHGQRWPHGGRTDHRRQNQKRRCARRSAGSRCYGSEKDLGDHSDVPSAAVDRCGYSF